MHVFLLPCTLACKFSCASKVLLASTQVSCVLLCPPPAAQVHNEGGAKRVVVTKNLPGERWLKVLTQLARCAAIETLHLPCLACQKRTVCPSNSSALHREMTMGGVPATQVLTAAGCRVEVCTSEDTILDVPTIKRLIGKKCDGVIGQLTEARQPLGLTLNIFFFRCCGIGTFVHSWKHMVLYTHAVSNCRGSARLKYSEPAWSGYSTVTCGLYRSLWKSLA